MVLPEMNHNVRGPGHQEKEDVEEEPFLSHEESWELQGITQSPADLHKAAVAGHLAEVEKAFEHDPVCWAKSDSQGSYPIHHATRNGHLHILQYFCSNHVDLDLCDTEGNTALHVAVAAGRHTVISSLLQAGADPGILNTSSMAPIHLAVEKDRQEELKELLKCEKVNVNQAGVMGATALHIAAQKDHDECAYLLLTHGSKMCRKCDLGRTALHEAAINASTKTMQVFIQHADKAGYKVCEILCYTDQCKVQPIHTAVQSGDIKAVKVCLAAGASIDAQQDDLATPIHLASRQGDLDMIHAMFTMQSCLKQTAINSCDVLGRTPLHMAALFNRLEVIRYLKENGANLNSQDEDGKTPVLLAATKAAWSCVQELLSFGCDLTVCDNNKRNIVHLIIIHGGQPSQFAFCDCNKKLDYLSNEADDTGCTPLHYASRAGQLRTIDHLMCAGAQLTAKNHKKESPLHFAARYGRYNICRRLLDSPNGHHCINDIDEQGLTPLHTAAVNGYHEVVTLLMHRGACAGRDYHGNTPVHCAAAGGYTRTMQTLLCLQGSQINCLNKAGDTPLHVAAWEGHVSMVTLLLDRGAELLRNVNKLKFLELAIQNEHHDVCVAVLSHHRWREPLSCCSELYGLPLIGFIKYMPDVGMMALDNCRIPSGGDTRDADFHYTYDFSFLQIPLEKVKHMRKHKIDYTPLYTLNEMVKFNRVEFLSHPLCLAFMEMKWSVYGMWLHMFNLLTYLVFLVSLTCFVTTYDMSPHNMVNTPGNNTTSSNADLDPRKTHNSQLGHGQALMACIILTFVSINIVKELMQMIQQRVKYFLDLTNLLEWIMYLTSGAFIIPFLVGTWTLWQWQCGAIVIFLAWVNLLLYLRRFNLFGIYVVMFLGILQTLVKVLIIFSILIIAFGMAFYILLSREETFAYRTPLMSLVTTIMMMMGQIEYIDYWVDPAMDNNQMTLHYDILTYIMLIAFLLLIPILLMNLLIGLAVGDIESVQKDARLKRLAAQVEMHTGLERKLPQKILEWIDRPEYKFYPNHKTSYLLEGWKTLTRGPGLTLGKDEHTTEHSENDYVYNELYNQKQRLKQISSKQDKQYELLRLIVQKMEIKTEADDIDESKSADRVPTNRKLSISRSKWSSLKIRHTLMKWTTPKDN